MSRIHDNGPQSVKTKQLVMNSSPKQQIRPFMHRKYTAGMIHMQITFCKHL